MPQSWTEFPLEIANIAVYAVFLVSNLNIYLDASKTYHLGKETYISPSPWLYQVWLVIDILLLCTMVYQFSPGGKQAVVNGISWSLPLLSVLDTIYVNLRAARVYGAAFVFAVLIYAKVTYIYYLIKIQYSLRSMADQLFVHTLFSIHHAWSTFLIVLSAFEAFDYLPLSTNTGAETRISIFFALLFLEATGALYAIYVPDGDVPASLVVSLSFIAIFERPHSTFVHWPALVFALFSVVWVLRSVYGLSIRSRESIGARVDDPEREPLVNGP